MSHPHRTDGRMAERLPRSNLFFFYKASSLILRDGPSCPNHFFFGGSTSYYYHSGNCWILERTLTIQSVLLCTAAPSDVCVILAQHRKHRGRRSDSW